MLGIELEYTTKYAISRKYGTLVDRVGDDILDGFFNRPFHGNDVLFNNPVIAIFYSTLER